VTPEQRLETFRKLVATSPDDAFPRYSLAMGLRSLGRNDEAVSEFRELARRKPEYVPTYLMLGQVLEALGRRKEAARAYEDGLLAAGRARNDHAASELGRAIDALKAQGT
jgi:predicted Zn-dependent protease